MKPLETKPLEKIKRPSFSEKVFLKAKNLMAIKAGAYIVSAAAAVGAGKLAQEAERSKIGYDPEIQQKLKEELIQSKTGSFEDFKNERKESAKQELKKWFSDIYEKVKQSGGNPKEFIKTTDAYKSLLLKHYEVLENIDDATFYFAALITFVMLAGYVGRTIEKMKGDPVDNKEKDTLYQAYNEVADFAMLLSQRVADLEKRKQAPSEDDVRRIVELLKNGKDSFPTDLPEGEK